MTNFIFRPHLSHIYLISNLFSSSDNLAVKKVRLIFPPATDHGLTDAIFSGDFRVIFNSFCFGDYCKFKREVVRRATSFGHDGNLVSVSFKEQTSITARFNEFPALKFPAV